MILDATWFLVILFVKHFICDFPLQAWPYMYANKGDLLHPGGYVHAGIHGYATMLCLIAFTTSSFELAVALGAVELVIHYIIDFSKVNIGKRYNLKPDNSNWYWILLGFDQLLHSLTYILIVQILMISGVTYG